MKQRPRIYYTECQKALMWERWQRGESLQHIAISIQYQLAASRNPTRQWVPSQNGLFFDAPHRHSV
jgi:hypothetical protein